MTSSKTGGDSQGQPPMHTPYESPRLEPLGSVAELTLGTLVTAMPENGGSGTSQV